MGLAERITELRRGVIHVEHTPKALVLERHLKRVEAANRNIGFILESISTGQFPPDVVHDLDNGIKERIEAVCEDMRIDQSVVVFNRVRLPYPQTRYDSVA